MTNRVSVRMLESGDGAIECISCPLILKTKGSIYFVQYRKTDRGELPNYYCEQCFQELAADITQVMSQHRAWTEEFF